MIFIRDRSDPSGRRVLICDNGGNLANSTPTLAYTIEDGDEGPHVVFQQEPIAITTEQALDRRDARRPGQEPGPQGTARPSSGSARSWPPARSLVREIEETARACGISKTMLRYARESLEVASSRSGFGKGAAYSWALPQKPDRKAPSG